MADVKHYTCEGPQIKPILNETLKNFVETSEHDVFWWSEQLVEVDTRI